MLKPSFSFLSLKKKSVGLRSFIFFPISLSQCYQNEVSSSNSISVNSFRQEFPSTL